MGSKGAKSSFEQSLEFWEMRPSSPEEKLMDDISSLDLLTSGDFAAILQDTDTDTATLQKPSSDLSFLADELQLPPVPASAPPALASTSTFKLTTQGQIPSLSSGSAAPVTRIPLPPDPCVSISSAKGSLDAQSQVHQSTLSSGLPPVNNSRSPTHPTTNCTLISPPGSKRVSIMSPTKPSIRGSVALGTPSGHASAAQPRTPTAATAASSASTTSQKYGEADLAMGRRPSSKNLNPFEDDDYLDETTNSTAFTDEASKNAPGTLKRMLPPKADVVEGMHTLFDSSGRKVVRSRSFAESMPHATGKTHRSIRGSIVDGVAAGSDTKPLESNSSNVPGDLPKNKGSISQLQGRVNRSARASLDRIEGIEKITLEHESKLTNGVFDRVPASSADASLHGGERFLTGNLGNQVISPTRNGVKSSTATGGAMSPQGIGMGERNASMIAIPATVGVSDLTGDAPGAATNGETSCTQEQVEDKLKQQQLLRQQQLHSRSFHGSAAAKPQSVFASSISTTNLGKGGARRPEFFKKIGSSSDAGESEDDDRADPQANQMRLLDECFLQCANQRLVRFCEAKHALLKSGVHMIAVVFIKQFLNPESVKYFQQSRTFLRMSVAAKYKPEDYVIMVLGASPFKFISSFCDNAKLKNVNLGPLPTEYHHDTHVSVLADPEQAFYTLVSSMKTDKIIPTPTIVHSPSMLRAGSSSTLGGPGSPARGMAKTVSTSSVGNEASAVDAGVSIGAGASEVSALFSGVTTTSTGNANAVPGLGSASGVPRSDSKQKGLGGFQFPSASRSSSSAVNMTVSSTGTNHSQDVSAKRISETFKTASKINDPLFNWSDRPIPSYLLIDLDGDTIVSFDMEVNGISQDGKGENSAFRLNSGLSKKNIG